MKRGLAVLALAIMLAGCQTNQVVTVDRYHVVTVPDALYKCPVLRTFPDANKLTDLDVARLLVRLQKNNLTCAGSLQAIKAYLGGAAKLIK